MDTDGLSFDPELLADLEIFERTSGAGSIFDQCNFTKTYGGRARLQEKFSHPFANISRIQEVQRALQCMLTDLGSWELPFSQELLHFLEQYRDSSIAPVSQNNQMAAFFEGLSYRWIYQRDYEFIIRGAYRFLAFLQSFRQAITRLSALPLPAILKKLIEKALALLTTPALQKACYESSRHHYFTEILRYDWLIRIKAREEIIQLFECMYEWDALLAMAKSVDKYGLTFPEFVEVPQPQVHLEDVYHLLLDNPVPNNLQLEKSKNFLFLTGPNMAGKTTYMKACGIAVYLAHLGLGVPARTARLSAFEGMFSSIQTTDHIGVGYSFFYSEVVKSKQLAQTVRSGQKVFVVIDELFKGTNVKDAFDCSQTVVSGLLHWPNGVYMVSTHLLELASVYQACEQVIFSYFESAIIDGKPIFSYRLTSGVSGDRLGLLILKNEGVAELLVPPGQLPVHQ